MPLSSRMSVCVKHCGRAMQVGAIGGAVLGQRVVVPAQPVWSLLVLAALSLVLAVVVVCTGVSPVDEMF